MTNSAGPEFVLGGMRTGTGVGGQGAYANYRSKTVYSNSEAYSLYIDSNTVQSWNNPYRYQAMSLRCLAATLYTHYPNYTSMTNSAGPEFVLGGYRINTTMGRQAERSYYWSNSANSLIAYAHTLYLVSSNLVNPTGQGDKYNSFSLRCLAVGRKGSDLPPPTPSTNYSLTPLDQTL